MLLLIAYKQQSLFIGGDGNFLFAESMAGRGKNAHFANALFLGLIAFAVNFEFVRHLFWR
jgi:hypothetical protein